MTHFDFPGRRVFEWALILPLAVPTYLAAYSYVEVLGLHRTDPAAACARLTGAETLKDYWFPDISTDAGAAFVLSMVLYPYVYVACRAFFLMQSGSINIGGADARRGGLAHVLHRDAAAVSRPAIVVGVTLAMMEVVNDLGAVQYFGINSLTAVIYTTWINRSDFGGAAQLAVTIVLIIGDPDPCRAAGAARPGLLDPPRQPGAAGARPAPWRRGALARASSALLLLALGFGVPFGAAAPIWRSATCGPSRSSSRSRRGCTTVTLALLGALITVAIGLYAARPERAACRCRRRAARSGSRRSATPSPARCWRSGCCSRSALPTSGSTG